MYFVSRRSVFDLTLAGNRPEKRPKPRVRPGKPTPQPGKNAPLLDKRLPGLTGQKNDLEIPGLD